MTYDDSKSYSVLSQELDRLFKEFGIMRVLYALAKRAVKPRVSSLAAHELSPHLRKDIGLPPSTGSPDYRMHMR